MLLRETNSSAFISFNADFCKKINAWPRKKLKFKTPRMCAIIFLDKNYVRKKLQFRAENDDFLTKTDCFQERSGAAEMLKKRGGKMKKP